ncbi:hypothetical protein D1007_61080 [Hordeum vulgare]|nr:hypothetical protein D1007_61080 [Hordeum vulgare]
MSNPPSDSWEGSNITPSYIEYLRRTRKLPAEDLVEACAPGDEISPQPRDGERVVFGSHFIVGFVMPVSAFFRNFLAQMHHLGANVVQDISCYVALCWGYLGFHPFASLFQHFFYFRSQKHKSDGSPYSCGGVVVYWRLVPPFPRMTFKDSCKKWQQTFFYVRNLNAARD